jgi:hypothetical protein
MLRVVRPGGLCVCRDEREPPPGSLSALQTAWFTEFLPLQGMKAPVEAVPKNAIDVRSGTFNTIQFIMSFRKKG